MTTYVQHAKPASPKRVGVLALFGCPIPPDSPVPLKLAELGWIEGQTFVFECVSTLDRLASLERLATLEWDKDDERSEREYMRKRLAHDRASRLSAWISSRSKIPHSTRRGSSSES
jgi:hypothetical protein